MNIQKLLKQLAEGNFKVECSKAIPGTDNRIGIVQEIKFFGTNDAGVTVHFEEYKWDVYFTPEGIVQEREGRYSMRDLKATNL